MTGSDIFVSRMLTKREIASALEAVLGIRQMAIMIVKDISEIEGISSKIEIICQTFLCKNDSFPLRIDTYIRNENIHYDELLFIKDFAQILKVNVLISDESINPFTYHLIHFDGEIENVSLSSTMVDAEGIEIELKEI